MALVDDRGARIESSGQSFDRQPPQDIAAEQSVLGGMLLSKDAIADVVERLHPGDFYRPVHQILYDCILDLYGRGEPADPVTVSAELERRGELLRLGGAPYLHTLISMVPTAANAGYYAVIVAEKAVLRRLVEAGTRIVQLGYYGSEGAEVDEVVDRAQAAVYEVTERRMSEDYVALEELLQPTMDELDAIASRGGASAGVPTGFVDLDAVTNGLHPGQMVIIAARPGIGKALALDTVLPTPAGWTTMGDVAVGDQLLGADGRPTTVLAVTDVMCGRPCYQVVFSDGTIIVADAQHQWCTETRAARRSARQAATGDNRQRDQRAFADVRTTEEIAATLRCRTADGRPNHSVSNARPLDLPEQALLVPPYSLGVWLGAGTSHAAHVTSADPEIAAYVEAEGLRATPRGGMRYTLQLPEPESTGERSCVVCATVFVPRTSAARTCGRSCDGPARLVPEAVPPPVCRDCGGPSCGLVRCQHCRHRHGTIQARLRTLGVLGNKHIPSVYLRASIEQRRALLAGLMDTDGTVTSSGSVQFTVTRARLARDIRELVVGLGYRCEISAKQVRDRTDESVTAYTITFSSEDEVFRLERKRLAHKERRCCSSARSDARYIVDVRPVPSVPVRCVQVNAGNHLYLAGESMIPTHNSTLGLDFARSCSVTHGMTSVIFSLEMSRTEIVMRLLSAEARIRLADMRSGRMSDDDWTRLARRMGEISEAPLFIDDSPNMTMMEIRAKARRLKQRNDLRLIIVDYMQLMTSGKKVESRQQEVSEFSRHLKLLAKELEVPVVTISQLNRGPEQRTDKKPMLADLRESGCLTAGTRILRADTGAEVTLGELLASGARNVPVWSLDERLRLVPRLLTHAFPSGRKETFRVTLRSGRMVEATANHPFRTPAGWLPLGALIGGSRVAVPRSVPAPLQVQDCPDDHVSRLAHRSRQKSIPAEVFGFSQAQVALFLRELWAADGCIRYRHDGDRRDRDRDWDRDWPGWDWPGRDVQISYATNSRQLADDVALLLLRTGVSSRIVMVDGAGCSGRYRVTIGDPDNQRSFLSTMSAGVRQKAQEKIADRALKMLNELTAGASVDTIPGVVWERLRSVLAERDMAHRAVLVANATKTCGDAAKIDGMNQGSLAQVVAVLEEADLDLLAVNDVFWDEICSIESIGQQDVYDATVLGTHSFVANGVVVHNSLEQDADMVMLIHRPDAWERDDPRAGEADLILAKHRNGPTSTVTVAHQLHYSRFFDMAQG